MPLFKKWLLIAGAVLIFLAFVLPLLKTGLYKAGVYGGGLTVPDRAGYNAIGTAAAPVTLTTADSGAGSASSTDVTMFAKGMGNMVLAGSYTPKSYGSKLYLSLQRSVDNGSTYKNYAVLQPGTDYTLVYTTATTGTHGIPFQIPGTNVSASGTAINFSYDLTVAADYLRVFALENTTSTAGTLNVNVLLNN